MSLNRVHYVRNWSHNEDKQYAVTAKLNNKSIPFLGNIGNVTSVVEEVMYWRKVNAIHKWFVDNVQNGVDDCRNYYVSIDQLQELRSLCLAVLFKRERADELLPCQSGCFFGDTEYDDYYFEQLEATAKVIEQLINDQAKAKKLGHSMSFEYQSSW